jgi:hypothetical protein
MKYPVPTNESSEAFDAHFGSAKAKLSEALADFVSFDGDELSVETDEMAVDAVVNGKRYQVTVKEYKCPSLRDPRLSKYNQPEPPEDDSCLKSVCWRMRVAHYELNRLSDLKLKLTKPYEYAEDNTVLPLGYESYEDWRSVGYFLFQLTEYSRQYMHLKTEEGMAMCIYFSNADGSKTYGRWAAPLAFQGSSRKSREAYKGFWNGLSQWAKAAIEPTKEPTNE